jgi:hypothetical protein
MYCPLLSGPKVIQAWVAFLKLVSESDLENDLAELLRILILAGAFSWRHLNAHRSDKYIFPGAESS